MGVVLCFAVDAEVCGVFDGRRQMMKKQKLRYPRPFDPEKWASRFHIAVGNRIELRTSGADDGIIRSLPLPRTTLPKEKTACAPKVVESPRLLTAE